MPLSVSCSWIHVQQPGGYDGYCNDQLLSPLCAIDVMRRTIALRSKRMLSKAHAANDFAWSRKVCQHGARGGHVSSNNNSCLKSTGADHITMPNIVATPSKQCWLSSNPSLETHYGYSAVMNKYPTQRWSCWCKASTVTTTTKKNRSFEVGQDAWVLQSKAKSGMLCVPDSGICITAVDFSDDGIHHINLHSPFQHCFGENTLMWSWRWHSLSIYFQVTQGIQSFLHRWHLPVAKSTQRD